MPRHAGFWKEAWATCDRCGFIMPVSMLRRQKSLKLCTLHGCFDNLDVERRTQLIGEVLSSGDEFGNELSEVVYSQDPDLPIL